MQRPNLKVLTHASGDAHPVRGSGAPSASSTFKGRRRPPPCAADRELILSGGPINSPQLLKLSGIGPAAETTHARHSRHPRFARRGRETCRTTWNSISRWPARNRSRCIRPSISGNRAPDRRARWLLRKGRIGRQQSFRGPAASSAAGPGVPYPDIQYHFLPMAVALRRPRRWRRSMAFKRTLGRCAARGRGWVRLASTNPLDKPRILFNYLSEPDDWTEMRACVRLTREIFAQPAFDRYRGREIQPGAEVQNRRKDRCLHPRQGSRAPITRHALARWAGPQDPLASG